jgi:hypothetical protein
VFKPIDALLEKFHVVTVISNPVRYKSRLELYRKFEKHMGCSGAKLWTVETAFGDRPFEVTETGDPQDVQFRSFDEIWHKENMINLALSRLPRDWEYVAWVDADVLFQNPNWVSETVHQLQHYMVVQLFGDAVDLGPRGEPVQLHRGFVKGYFEEGFKCPNMKRPQHAYYGGPSGSFAHPGYAWAARREALEHLGGLIDWAILGSGDHHMAMGLIGEIVKTFPSQMHSRYAQKMLRWQERALKYLHRDIGFVDGTLTHFWHGKKKDRKYRDRWDILTKNNFDPDVDLKRDSQGLYCWTDNNYRLRDEVRAYFRQRNEDSVDL